MKAILLVFVGGGIGAIMRELFIISTPSFLGSFPLDIFLANILAAILLGLVAALHGRKKLSNGSYLFLGTGVMGGLSTFSSLVYVSVVLMSVNTFGIFIAAAYLMASLIIGYLAVSIGYKLGGS